MRIDFEELKEYGFRAELAKHRRHVDIVPEDINPAIAAQVRDLCGVLGFNDTETTEFHNALHRIQVMSAIRKCSNW